MGSSLDGWAEISCAARRPAEDLHGALARGGEFQLQLLARILRRNAETAFGRSHAFKSIDSYRKYCDRVEIRSYDEIAPWIVRAASGEQEVLTRDPVVAFEQTGGSTSGAKIVPYTDGLLGAFRAALLPWLGSLLDRRPAIAGGTAFVSVSPNTGRPAWTLGGIPIGLPSEAAYLGRGLEQAFAKILANTMNAGAYEDLSAWDIATLCNLVQAGDLTLISVWSPTFLTRLLEVLADKADAVMDRLSPTGDARSRLEEGLRGGVLRPDVLWPMLDTVSCWTDGPSRAYSDRLTALFPEIHIEPKGLLATEGPITLPLGFPNGSVPALNSTFLEFVDADGRSRLVHEVEAGCDYRIVMTTLGGLYRYDIGDIVRCNDRMHGIPLFEFRGRSGVVSDLVGEKLTDGFVARALSDLPVAGMLVPQAADTLFYEFWIDGPETISADMVDTRLCANPHYAHARRLGQLAVVRIVSRPGFMRAMHEHKATEGRRLGDLKAQSLLPLSNGSDLSKRFQPDGSSIGAHAHGDAQ